MNQRGGHSLPELIVAIVVLGACAAAVGASAVLGVRWTTEAGARQEALGVVGPLLDSLLTAPPVPDSVEGGAFDISWEVAGDPPELVVRAALAGSDTLVELRAKWVPRPPVLPSP